jgi:beta-lactamase regulating signal transducer with metallopeptidase domain
VSCISATCPSELSSAEQLSQQFCNVASSHPTLSFPTPTTTASSASGTATPTAISSPSVTSATATTAQSTSAAGRGRGDGGTVVLMGLVVGVVGVFVGVLYV